MTRVLGAIFSVFLAVMAVVTVIIAVSHGPVSMVWNALLFFAVAVGIGCYVWRVALEVSADAVIISNPFSTRTVPLSSISAASPGYYGMALTTRDGRTFTAMAVQKGNLASRRGRRTAADQVAEAIHSAAGLRPPGGH